MIVSLIAFNHGGNFAVYPATTAYLFGKTNVGANFGIIFTLYGVLSVVGIYFLPRISGNIDFFDFTLVLVGLGISALCCIFILHRMYIHTKRKLKAKLLSTSEYKYLSLNTTEEA